MMNEDGLRAAIEAFDASVYQYDFIEKNNQLVPLSATTEELMRLYAATLVIRNISESTIKNRLVTLADFFKLTNSSPKTATVDDVRNYIYIKKINNIKATTINGYRATLNSFFEFLAAEGEINANIVTAVPKLRTEKRLLKPMPQMDVVAIKNSASAQPSAINRLRDRAIIELLYTSGMRVGELVDLKFSDIKRSEHCDGSTPVLIRNGKGKKERYTYINDEALWHLDKYLKERRGRSEYVFVSTIAPYNKLSTHAVEQRVRTMRKDAGVDYATPHTMRRTCATRMIGAGVPIQDVQQILGHASVETTTRYAQTSDAHVRGEHRRAFG